MKTSRTAQPVAAETSTYPDAFVSLSAFGADKARRDGQLQLAQLCEAAGADGVEIREELLIDAEHELRALGAWLRTTRVRSAYSCPRPLFTEGGDLNRSALDHALRASRSLGSVWLKMSIGHFIDAYDEQQRASLNDLSCILQRWGATLLIENDQSVVAGSAHALQRFFTAADASGISLQMTFDMGNWSHVDENACSAAALFSQRVRYIHAKGVRQTHGRWIAVPLAQSEDSWESILRALPRSVPRAIEYPLVADDLLAHVRDELRLLRNAGNRQATMADCTGS